MTAFINSDEYISSRDAIYHGMKDLGVSANRLAKEASISAASLSQAISGKYTGDVRKIFNAALAALETIRTTRQFSGALPHCETSVMRLVNGVCDEAWAMRHNDSIGLLTGVVGVGKSTCLMKYASSHSFAIYLCANPGTTRSVLLSDFAEKLGISQQAYKTIADKQAAIKRSLASKPRLIIFDEADKVVRTVLETMRYICDHSQSSLVFAGREILSERLAGNEGEYGEIASRILSWNPHVRSLTEDDVNLILSSSKFGRSFDDDAREMIVQCSELNGRVLQRLMGKLTKYRSNMLAQKKDTTITAKMISEIYHMVIVPRSAAWKNNN